MSSLALRLRTSRVITSASAWVVDHAEHEAHVGPRVLAATLGGDEVPRGKH
jgi:hypothetical protein